MGEGVFEVVKFPGGAWVRVTREICERARRMGFACSEGKYGYLVPLEHALRMGLPVALREETQSKPKPANIDEILSFVAGSRKVNVSLTLSKDVVDAVDRLAEERGLKRARSKIVDALLRWALKQLGYL